ncbi:MAG: hypothetical protein IPM29_15875 [Planctomycetes bacterium]|nr:hypothetical protein [Planctomycetota bacterium]
MRSAMLVISVGAVLGLAAACSNDIQGPPGRAVRTERALPASAGQGFGVQLAPAIAGLAAPSLRGDSDTPLAGLSVAGVALPRVGAQEPARIAILAFASALDASAVDPSITDANSADDVFVAAVVDNQRLLRGRDVPTAFAEGLGQVFRDERCTRCHSFQAADGFRVDPRHVGKTLDNSRCGECHTQSAIRVPGLAPDVISWIAPGAEFDLRGRDLGDIQADIIAREGDALDEHLREDDRILWAIEHGRVPFQEMADGGPVPISLDSWLGLVDAWEVGGRQLRNQASAGLAGAQTIAVASVAGVTTATGSGPSTAPAIVFVPDPGFPGIDEFERSAGVVWIAFATGADDIVTGASGATQLALVRYELRVRTEPGESEDRVVVALASLGSATLVTLGAGGPGDGDSGTPALAVRGGSVVLAFSSRASNLVAGFVDGNGADAGDVFVRVFDAQTLAATTSLVSSIPGAAEAGGDGASSAPHVGGDGLVVAFESTATDLVADDANGVGDVFCRTIGSGAFGDVVRASVRNGGGESPIAARHGRAFHDAATGDLWIAFETDATGLEQGAARAATDGARSYLFWSGAVRTFALGGDSRHPSAAPELAPDGSRIAFVTPAALDRASTDANGVDDVYTLDFAAMRAAAPIGSVQELARASVTGIGGDGATASARPVAAVLVGPDGAPSGDALLAFESSDELLGRSDTTDVVLHFLRDRAVLPLVADFTASDRVGLAGNFTAKFRDLSTGATEWEWFVNGVSFSTERDPTFPDPAAGDYDIELVVRDGLGGEARLTRRRYVVAFQTRSWTEIFDAHIQGSCGQSATGCHGDTGAARGLVLTSAATARTNLVDVVALACGGTAGVRVVPGEPDQSFFAQVIDPLTDTCLSNGIESAMKLSRSATLEIRDWIRRGALAD